MRSVQKAITTLVQHVLSMTIFKVYLLIVYFWFDIKHNTDTGGLIRLDDLSITSDNKPRGYRDQATMVIPLRQLFNHIKLMMPREGVFVDLGCGKGRVLLIASSYGFREVRGVEFAHELCEIAKRNCAVYKQHTTVDTDFQIIESDVVDYLINTDETVFYLFNPFDEVVLSEILDNIAASLEIRPRRILIIYFNPVCGDIIEWQDKSVELEECVVLGYRFALYASAEYEA